MCSLLKSLFILTLVSFSQASLKKGVKLTKKFVTPVETPKKCSNNPAANAEAWARAATIDHRNPNIWRLDENGNIIMTNELTKNSPISYNVIEEGSSYKAKLNYFATPWIFSPEAEILMNIIEIAVVGFVTDESHRPVCWTPSIIHHNFHSKSAANLDAERWVSMIQVHPSLGLMGHDNIFSPMGVSIRKDPSSRAIVVGTPPTCSDYVSSFVPHPILAKKASLPDSDDEGEEGKTDHAASSSIIEMSDADLSRLNDLSDEEFDRIMREETEPWIPSGSSSGKKSGGKKSSKTPGGSGKSTLSSSTGGSSIAHIDGSGGKVKKLVSGTHSSKK